MLFILVIVNCSSVLKDLLLSVPTGAESNKLLTGFWTQSSVYLAKKNCHPFFFFFLLLPFEVLSHFICCTFSKSSETAKCFGSAGPFSLWVRLTTAAPELLSRMNVYCRKMQHSHTNKSRATATVV